jgi:hypothetical protein
MCAELTVVTEPFHVRHVLELLGGTTKGKWMDSLSPFFRKRSQGEGLAARQFAV